MFVQAVSDETGGVLNGVDVVEFLIHFYHKYFNLMALEVSAGALSWSASARTWAAALRSTHSVKKMWTFAFGDSEALSREDSRRTSETAFSLVKRCGLGCPGLGTSVQKLLLGATSEPVAMFG